MQSLLLFLLLVVKFLPVASVQTNLPLPGMAWDCLLAQSQQSLLVFFLWHTFQEEHLVFMTFPQIRK